MWRTWLVSIPVGEGNFIPAEPVERTGTTLIMEADPEGITRATEHQAVGEGLLEPLKDTWGFFRKSALTKRTVMTFKSLWGSMMPYVPIGNGNKGSSIVLTRLPCLVKSKQIFSHPVTSWTVPLPALKGGKKS